MIQHFYGLNGGNTNAEANAFINAVISGGDTLSSTEKSAITTLVATLKSKGLWNKFYCFYPIVGSTATAHKWNLKDPRDLDAAYRLTFFNSPTHSGTGITFNGTNQYCNTHLNVLNVMSQTNCSAGLYCNGGSNTNAFAHGAVSNYSTTATELYNTVAYQGFATNGESCTNTVTAGTYTTPNILIGTSDGTNGKGYYNGSLFKSVSYVGGAMPSLEYYIGCNNFQGGPANFANTKLGTFFLGKSLSTTNAADLYNAINTFNSTLSR